MPVQFPPVESASPEGLVAIGGDLSPETLVEAYKNGIFPWPISKTSPLTWFSPDPRGALILDDLHVAKSFQKFLKKTNFEVKFNEDFASVIKACSTTIRKHEAGTWITNDIIKGYTRFFEAGHAYCVEVYDSGELVGGLYGVSIGHFLSGESMFHTKSNASKLALYALCLIALKNQIPFIDTQMVTPVIESFGGKEIERKQFMNSLSPLIKQKTSRDLLFSHEFHELNQLC